MNDNAWIVVKVGGSLFDLPDLRARLHRFFSQLGEVSLLIVPGGGAMADAIREMDRIHQLGEEASHWLAIQAMSVNAHFLQELLPGAPMVGAIPEIATISRQWCLLDAWPFFRADEGRPDHWPHCWRVTSDSLAVRAAMLVHARELILLKSIDCEGVDRTGVDDYFSEALRQAPVTLSVRWVNLRSAAP